MLGTASLAPRRVGYGLAATAGIAKYRLQRGRASMRPELERLAAEGGQLAHWTRRRLLHEKHREHRGRV